MLKGVNTPPKNTPPHNVTWIHGRMVVAWHVHFHFVTLRFMYNAHIDFWPCNLPSHQCGRVARCLQLLSSLAQFWRIIKHGQFWLIIKTAKITVLLICNSVIFNLKIVFDFALAPIFGTKSRHKIMLKTNPKPQNDSKSYSIINLKIYFVQNLLLKFCQK